MLKLYLLLVTIFLISTFQGQVILRGIVIDSTNNQPLEAVYVAIENAPNNQTTTDALGRFCIKINSKNPIVAISYVGYKPLLIEPDTGRFVVKLQPDVLNLKDVTLRVSSGVPGTVSKIDLELKTGAKYAGINAAGSGVIYCPARRRWKS